jgi:hypothetical protein
MIELAEEEFKLDYFNVRYYVRPPDYNLTRTCLALLAQGEAVSAGAVSP